MPPNGSPDPEIGEGTRAMFERGCDEENAVGKIGQDRTSDQRPYPRSAPERIPGPECVGVDGHRAGSPFTRACSSHCERSSLNNSRSMPAPAWRPPDQETRGG